MSKKVAKVVKLQIPAGQAKPGPALASAGIMMPKFCSDFNAKTADRAGEIVPVIIVLRDIVVNAIKMEAAGKGKVVAAIGSGKLKTASLMVGTTLAFFYNIPFVFLHISVDQFLLYFACIMSIISAVQYFNMNKDIIFPSKAK